MNGSPYARRILRQLLEAIRPAPDEPLDWHLADPYLLRHAIQHAADAEQVDELLADLEFLVYADPATLQPETQGAQNPQARLCAAIWRATVAHRHARPSVRRQLLAMDAARFGQEGLAERLAWPVGRPPELSWVPSWATGSQVSTALLPTLSGHEGWVSAVAVGEVDGRPVAVSGGDDRTVRVWDLATGNDIATIAFPYLVLSIAAATDNRLVVGFDWEVAVLRRWLTSRPSWPAGDGTEPPDAYPRRPP